jgi:hypothetical protein
MANRPTYRPYRNISDFSSVDVPSSISKPPSLKDKQTNKLKKLDDKLTRYNQNLSSYRQQENINGLTDALKTSLDVIDALLEDKLKSHIKTSEFKRYNSETDIWIPNAYLNYGMWFDYLRAAELSDEFKVDWNKYRGWGGKRVVMNTHFKSWFRQYGETLFGSKKRDGKTKYSLDTKSPKPYAYHRRLKDWRKYQKDPSQFIPSDRQILRAKGHLKNVSQGSFP